MLETETAFGLDADGETWDVLFDERSCGKTAGPEILLLLRGDPGCEPDPHASDEPVIRQEEQQIVFITLVNYNNVEDTTKLVSSRNLLNDAALNYANV